MNFPVKATEAPAARTKESRQISIFLAGIFVVFAVAQLFTFEEFTQLVLDFRLPFGEGASYALASGIVAAEIIAIPFLLRMKLSIGFRFFSMLSGWFVALFWFFVSVWVVSTSAGVTTIGFIGTVVDAVPGWWAAFVSVALGVLAAWASWGLWPVRAVATRKK